MSGRSPVRSPGRLKEEDAAAHAARVKEARAAYSRLSRAGGELNRELRPANPRKSSPVVGSSRNGSPGTSPRRSADDILHGLDSLAAASGRMPRNESPGLSEMPGHAGWLRTVLSHREETEHVDLYKDETDEFDVNEDEDDVELTEEETRAFREYRESQDLRSRLGFSMTEKNLSPMRGGASPRRSSPSPSKKKIPLSAAELELKAAQDVLKEMAQANKSLLTAAATTPEAYRLTRDKTKRIMRDIGLASDDEGAEKAIDLDAKVSIDLDSKAEQLAKDIRAGDGNDDDDGTHAAWSREIEEKLSRLMISRHEMRERGEALNRMMAEADERNAKLNAKLNQEADRDAKIAQLMASATATARATQFALDSHEGLGEHELGEYNDEDPGTPTGKEGEPFFASPFDPMNPVASANESIAALERAIASLNDQGPIPEMPTREEMEAEIRRRLPKLPPLTMPMSDDDDYDEGEVDELLEKLEAEEAARAAGKKHKENGDDIIGPRPGPGGSPRSPTKGNRPPLPPDASAHRSALVLEALAEADLEVKDVTGGMDGDSTHEPHDHEDPATPTAFTSSPGAGAPDNDADNDAVSNCPTEEQIAAKLAELHATARECQELMAARRGSPARQKLIDDVQYVLKRSAEDAKKVPFELPASLTEMPEFKVPSLEETQELIRDMEERVKATAARLNASLTPNASRVIANGEGGLTPEKLKGLGRLNIADADHAPFTTAASKILDRPPDRLQDRLPNDRLASKNSPSRGGVGRASVAGDSPGLSPTASVDRLERRRKDLLDEEALKTREEFRAQLRAEGAYVQGEAPPGFEERRWRYREDVPDDETGKLKDVRDFQSLMDYAFD